MGIQNDPSPRSSARQSFRRARQRAPADDVARVGQARGDPPGARRRLQLKRPPAAPPRGAALRLLRPRPELRLPALARPRASRAEARRVTSACFRCCLPFAASWSTRRRGESGLGPATSEPIRSRAVRQEPRSPLHDVKRGTRPRPRWRLLVELAWDSAVPDPSDEESNSTKSLRRRSSSELWGPAPPGRAEAVVCGGPDVPRGVRERDFKLDVALLHDVRGELTYATPKVSSVTGVAASTARWWARQALGRASPRSARGRRGASTSRPSRGARRRPRPGAVRVERHHRAPTFAAFAAVTLTSSESLQSSGALTFRASRYAAFTADVASIRGGVPSNITSALSLPRGSADPSNPRLGSVNVAGGSAVTFSSPSAKPCVLRTTKLASHALPDPTTNPGRTRTPPTRISGLSMARPASVVVSAWRSSRAYTIGRSTDRPSNEPAKAPGCCSSS